MKTIKTISFGPIVEVKLPNEHYPIHKRKRPIIVRPRKTYKQPLPIQSIKVFKELSKSKEFRNDDLKKFIKKFFILFSKNQWKRERYAPSFHLDDFSLDPNSWYRFPILSGNYDEELEAL